ncbi:MAG: dihydroorotase [Gammaproteobacteria bacterium]|nr:dihydroorotase [Gammaproteobacteria bacterium]
MSLVIRNGYLVDPANGVDREADLYIDATGFVAGIGEKPRGFKPEQELDAGGCIVCPGLVDLRARLREPGLEYKATIESETAAAVTAGITTLCCPPDTNPPVDTPAMAQLIQQRAWRYEKAFVHPLGALTRGLAGAHLADMAALEEAGCVGFSNALEPIRDTAVLRHAMEYAASFDLTVFLHCEDPWLRGKGCVHEGEVATRLGLPAIPDSAERIGVSRDLALIQQTGVRAHFCHLSSASAVALVTAAREQGLPVTADVTAHHLHLTEHDIGFFNTQCHVRPPLRSQRDRDALRHAVAEGAISVICSDHEPHEPDAKLAAFIAAEPGISALETLLPLTLRLVDDGSMEMGRAISALTSEPAAVLRIDAGHLGVGATADVCIFDPEAEWVLDPDQMASRGTNTPFAGWPFRGRVIQTLVGGEVVFGPEPVRCR